MTNYNERLENSSEIDMSSLISALWRNKGWVILWTLVGLACATLFLLFVSPTYKADTRILIEQRETVFTRPSDEQNLPVANNFDQLSIVSQVEILRSRNILLPVVERLELYNEPEFNEAGSSGNPVSNLFTLLGLGSTEFADTREERVIAKLYDNLAIYPVGDSRVVSVEVQSEKPELAARIANAISDEYLRTQREDTRVNTETASRFLDSEIQELRSRVAESEQAVEEFRSSAGLIGIDDESTLTQQQLGEMLTLRSEVSAQRAEAEAKADQIRRLINSGAALDSSSDVQGSPLIQSLREQQVALRAQIVDLSTSLLPNHPQVQAARSQLAELEQEIARQAGLIAQALEGDAEVAQVREEELGREVARLKAETARANEQEVQLRALEREARAQRDLLETYLTRFREATARQNTELLPVNARVISKASAPIEPFFPKTGPTLTVAGFAGFFLSSLIILVSELMSGRALIARSQPVEGVAEGIEPVFSENAVEPRTATQAVPKTQPTQYRSLAPEILAGAAAKVATHKQTPITVANMAESDLQESLTESYSRGSLSDEEDGLVNAIPAAAESDKAMTGENETVADTRKLRRLRSDLYSLQDIVGNVQRYELSEIFIMPVFDGEDCGDFALDTARALAGSVHRVIFIDLTDATLDNVEPLVGVSDVIAGDVALDDIVFEDPTSPIDLVASGTMPIDREDWTDGYVGEILSAFAQSYDYIVAHVGDGVASEYLTEIIDRSDMLVFAVGSDISRQEVADILVQQMGDVPAHSLFVRFSADGDYETAA